MEELLGLQGVFSALLSFEVLKAIYSQAATKHFEDWSEDRKS